MMTFPDADVRRPRDRSRWRNSLLIFVATLSLALTSAYVAYAAPYYYSSVSTMGSYAGYDFRNQAWVYDANPGQGATRTWVLSGTPPTGWLGAEGRVLRQSDGAICSTTGMLFTTTPVSSIARGSWRPINSSLCPSGGQYYSQGKAGRWNGNGYNYQYTFRTVAVRLYN